MNQSTPPHNPYDSTSTAGPSPDSMDANPYLNQRDNVPPDLDAAAPSLRTEEQQRLNRKALMFLAGIVGLLIIMAFWIFSSADEEEQTAPEVERVATIPTTPGGSELPLPNPEPEPIAVQPYDSTPAADSLPPLPDDGSGSYAGGGRDYATGPVQPAAPPPPSLLERRMGADMQQASGMGAADPDDPSYGAGMAGPSGQAAPAQVERADAASARFLRNPDALLVRGTYVRCVLETRIVTDIPGFTSCIVTEPVYSINGRSLLLPKGSKVSGRYQDEPTGPRIAVVWDRITTPNGIDVNMMSPGVDNLGGAGHPGHYTAHWPQKIASALLISLISDAFKYAAAENGPPTTSVADGVVVQSPYESTTARTMERLANEAVAKSLRRPATVTINQGTVVNIYVAKDVDFSGVIARR